MSIDAFDELVGRASAIAIDPSFKAYFPMYAFDYTRQYVMLTTIDMSA